MGLSKMHLSFHHRFRTKLMRMTKSLEVSEILKTLQKPQLNFKASIAVATASIIPRMYNSEGLTT